MAIFISTTYFGDGSEVVNALNQLREAGFRNIEIGSNHSKYEVKDLILYNNTKYIIHNYFPSTDDNFVLNLASENSQIREASIRFMEDTIKICQKHNIEFYTIHPGFLGEVSKAENRRSSRNFDFKFKKNTSANKRQRIIDRTVTIIKTLYDFAENHDVTLLIENEGSKTSKDFVIFALPRELKMLKNGIRNLRFNFNLAHAILSGINLSDQKVFDYFYKNSEFFEVSEIDENIDSHLPILNKGGQITTLIKKYSKYFAKKNIILEYRNVRIEKVKKSYSFLNKILNSSTPKIK